MTDRIPVSTEGDADMLDITDQVQDRVSGHGYRDGHAVVFVPGATGALTTIEFEPGLRRDFPDALERLAPRDMRYFHEETWHDGNGHSHVRASLLGPSLTVPFERGTLLLGTWQQIVFLDFDNRPRQREIIVQLCGERGSG